MRLGYMNLPRLCRRASGFFPVIFFFFFAFCRLFARSRSPLPAAGRPPVRHRAALLVLPVAAAAAARPSLWKLEGDKKAPPLLQRSWLPPVATAAADGPAKPGWFSQQLAVSAAGCSRSPSRLVPSCRLAPGSGLPSAPACQGTIRRRNRTGLGGIPAESSSLLQQVTRSRDLSSTRMCFTYSDWESGLGWSSIHQVFAT
jgi:hypothetical protein